MNMSNTTDRFASGLYIQTKKITKRQRHNDNNVGLFQ